MENTRTGGSTRKNYRRFFYLPSVIALFGMVSLFLWQRPAQMQIATSEEIPQTLLLSPQPAILAASGASRQVVVFPDPGNAPTTQTLVPGLPADTIESDRLTFPPAVRAHPWSQGTHPVAPTRARVSRAASGACTTVTRDVDAAASRPIRGAGAEIRTRTPLRAAEFKSAASAIPPLRHSRKGTGGYRAAGSDGAIIICVPLRPTAGRLGQ